MRNKKTVALLSLAVVLVGILGLTAAAYARTVAAPAATQAPAATKQDAPTTAAVTESESETADDGPVTLPAGGITVDQAKAVALAACPGASVQSVDLSDENGTIVYSVELGDGREVKVDAKAGTVTAIENPDENEASALEDANGETSDDDGETND